MVHSAAGILLAAFALVACGPGGNADAGGDTGPGMDASMEAAAPDVRDVAADRADTNTGPTFRQCTVVADCGGGTGNMCLTAFPGGICTRSCTTDRNCGSQGLCLQGLCFPRCSQGGGECLDFQADCAGVDAADPSRRVCVPGCFETARVPAGTFVCGMGLMCNPYTGVCSNMGPDPMLSDNGGPCMVDEDCRGGRCISELNDMGEPTGFLGGYCLSFGRLAPAEEYMMGGDIPRSNCPAGSGVIPFANTMPGDRIACLRLCVMNSDCRPGYTCDHLQDRMGRQFFRNGVCLPTNCRAMGMSCPAGFNCVTQPSDSATPPGLCVRAADAGTPDSGPVDSGPVDSARPDSGPADTGPSDTGLLPDITLGG